MPQDGRAILRRRVQRRVQVALCLHLCLQGLFPGSRQHVPPGLCICPCQNALARVPIKQYLLHQQGADVPVEAISLVVICCYALVLMVRAGKVADEQLPPCRGRGSTCIVQLSVGLD